VGRTKKIGTAGRFGNRYGKKDRQKVADIEKIEKQKHLCPNCNMPHVKRFSSGVWICMKCGIKFAGLAYMPKSEAAKKE